MRLPRWLVLALSIWRSSAFASLRNHDTHVYFSLHLDPSTSPHEVAGSIGACLEGKTGQLPDHYTFSTRKEDASRLDQDLWDLRRRRRKRGIQDSTGVLWYQKQSLRPRLVKRTIPPYPVRQVSDADGPPEPPPPDAAAVQALDDIVESLDITDPIFKQQWHLFNTVQLGHDLNVTGVWSQGITGNGTITSVIDDGLDMYSDDLKDNYFAEGSYDYNDPGPEPRPRLFDDKHGTRCAGEIAAGRNNICGLGMAYDGKVSGIRILSKPIDDEDEATAINYGFQQNQIYSCSWGPPDDGQTMDAPSTLIKRAMVNGIQHGRGGLGSIFVFAAGNGAHAGDNCNFDGYTNSIYSITVGAIDRQGNHPYYSEPCSAQLVVTYSSGGMDAIHTTDVGVNQCYDGHGGTSAAGPLVAGSVALALGVRPDLSWRDLQYLCIEAAIPIHLDDGEWQDTKIGKKFSHVYGYGKIDTWRLIEATKTFKQLKAQAWYHSPWLSVQHDIPQGDKGLASSFEITQDMLNKANLEKLEHVTVTMNIDHTRRGDLSVELRSPDGLVSHLSTIRKNDAAPKGYIDWTFMSVVHWGESGLGSWTVIVKDTEVNKEKGRFIDWRLNLWGECIDDTNQPLHPFPDDHEDDHETLPASVATTSVKVDSPFVTSPSAAPTDHIDRPVNAKPQNPSNSASSTPTSLEEADSSSTATPSPVPSDTFLPSFFPTFGVSKRTQIWIYGALSLILAFCAGLTAYFLIQRRKRRLRGTSGRDDYEFEVLDTEEQSVPLTGGAGAAGKNLKGHKRRAGELYDAFAGGSDDELLSSSEDDDQDEVDEGLYRDVPAHSAEKEGGPGTGSSKERDPR